MLNTKRAKADQVVANGVTIQSGAQFDFRTIGQKRLSAGTVFTAISNTSVNPINGTFANLMAYGDDDWRRIREQIQATNAADKAKRS